MIKQVIRAARRLVGSTSEAVRRKLRIMPVHRVLRDLARRGVDVSKMKALEVFGGAGSLYTRDLALVVRSLEAWEISPAKCEKLSASLPTVKVENVDSFKRIATTRSRFDLISIDNAFAPYGESGQYCEHFDLFPQIFRIGEDRVTLITHVVPWASPAARRVASLFDDRHLSRRREFYSTDTPDHVPLESMARTYETFANQAGYKMDWWFSTRRTVFFDFVYFMTLHFSKQD